MQTKTSYNFKVLRNSLLLAGCFAMFYSASSATFSSGGDKKKDGKKSVISTLNLKNNPLSFNNGYRFRSGLSFSSTSSGSLVMRGNTVRYQKGNSIYVLPVKQKVIFSKFKTPQKEIK